MARSILRWLPVLLLAFAASTPALAADRYFALTLNDLTLTSGQFPVETPDSFSQRYHTDAAWTNPYIALDGPGEAYVRLDDGSNDFDLNRDAQTRAQLHILLRLTDKMPAGCRLYLPKSDLSGMVILHFKFPPNPVSAPDAKKWFLEARDRLYGSYGMRRLPGWTWFRYLSMKDQPQTTETLTNRRWLGPDFDEQTLPGAPDRSDATETFSLMTGAVGLNENLLLDRRLFIDTKGKSTVDLATIDGITIAPMDWKTLLAGKDKPILDPLAAAVPADQHALFFPSFQAMLNLLDEADVNGTPIFSLRSSRSIDLMTRERAQRQLCLPTTQLSRLLGPKIIDGVAFTGSDAGLSKGSDMAVLFEARDATALMAALLAHQAQAAADPAVKPIKGDIDGVAWQGVRSADRSVCSYLAAIGKTVIVTNSPVQLERIVKTVQGKSPAMAGLDEYKFFRTRYALGDKQETALLIITDGAIRRWNSPRWKIAESRRFRALLALGGLQARMIDGLADGLSPEAAAKQAGDIEGVGTITWPTNQEPVSSIYGSPRFLTPIAELDLKLVTPGEAAAYARFREGYQHRWTRYFDPIALRFDVAPDRLAIDLTLMPLILESEYRQFTSLTAGVKFGDRDGDPHPQSLAHFIMAINPKAEPIAQAGNMLPPQAGVQANPLMWLGNWLTIYADEDPIWKKLAGKKSSFEEKQFFQLPLTAQFGVSDPLKLTLFLTSLRAMADQSAPGLSRWMRLDYNGQPYVRVASAAQGETTGTEEMKIFYAATPKRLIVTLREDMLKRALDRLKIPAAASADAATKEAVPAWLGNQLGLQLNPQAFELIPPLAIESYQEMLQKQSWSNLPILNEWHRKLKAADPMAFEEQYWKTRLVDPAGGSYVWNESWQTMESTVFGHPGQPKLGGELPKPLTGLKRINLGITFENNGLRARVEAGRKAADRP